MSIPTTQDILELRRKARRASVTIELFGSAQELWPYIANLSIVQLKAEEPSPELDDVPGLNGLRRVKRARFRFLGIAQEAFELPPEWSVPHSFRYESIFLGGPLRYLQLEGRIHDSTATDAPSGNRSRLELVASYVARIPVVGAVMVKKVLDLTAAAFSVVDRKVPKKDRTKPHAKAPGDAPADEKWSALAADWQKLLPQSEVVVQLAEYMLHTPGLRGRRLRPFAIADDLQLPRNAVLCAFLNLTKAGYFDLNWAILCPSCRGSGDGANHLSGINREEHCAVCRIRFNAQFDENVEVTFQPTAKLGATFDPEMIAGPPALAPHVHAQFSIEPGATRELQLCLTPAQYRLWSLGVEDELCLAVHAAGQDALQFEIDDHIKVQSPAGAQGPFGPNVALRIVNRSDKWRMLRIERHARVEPVVTAHYVTTLQDFRDLFGSEVLRPGLELSIANVVLLFSDLKDSTLLYETRGDAPAFSLVQDHFKIMIEAIRECGGGVVKTIGDAVMAVFTSEAAALRAALKILEAFEDWNTTHPPEQQIIIKLGLHMGPCIALELNDKLDYFGSTVNKAARVQGASTGNDLVVSERIYKSPEMARLTSAASRLLVSEFTAELKGIAGKSTLYRLALTPKAVSKE